MAISIPLPIPMLSQMLRPDTKTKTKNALRFGSSPDCDIGVLLALASVLALVSVLVLVLASDVVLDPNSTAIFCKRRVGHLCRWCLHTFANSRFCVCVCVCSLIVADFEVRSRSKRNFIDCRTHWSSIYVSRRQSMSIDIMAAWKRRRNLPETTSKEHILLRPDSYVGSIERQQQEHWIFRFRNKDKVLWLIWG